MTAGPILASTFVLFARAYSFSFLRLSIRVGIADDGIDPILFRARTAPNWTIEAWSFSDAVKTGTASLASGPILYRASTALYRTLVSSTLSASIQAGTASLAAGPIFPSA